MTVDPNEVSARRQSSRLATHHRVAGATDGAGSTLTVPTLDLGALALIDGAGSVVVGDPLLRIGANVTADGAGFAEAVAQVVAQATAITAGAATVMAIPGLTSAATASSGGSSTASATCTMHAMASAGAVGGAATSVSGAVKASASVTAAGSSTVQVVADAEKPARAITGGSSTASATSPTVRMAAAASTTGTSNATAVVQLTRTASASSSGHSTATATPKPPDLNFVVIGDSYTWKLQGGGATLSRIDAAYPFSFFGIVSNKTIVSMADVPACVVDPLTVSDQGNPIYGTGTGRGGYSARGLFVDRLGALGADMSNIAMFNYGQGGTSVKSMPTNTFGQPWSYGIPGGATTGLTAANAVAGDSQWARTDDSRPGDATTCAQRIASTPNLTILMSLGGNDVIAYGATWNWVDRTTGVLDSRWAPRADQTRDGLIEIADFIRRLNPSAHVVHVSYPNLPLDDSRRVVPQIRRPTVDAAQYTSNADYIAGRRNYPGTDYSTPYTNPWALQDLDYDPNWFLPGNPGAGNPHTHPGFWRGLFMAANLTRDWDYEGKDWTLQWYAHAYADERRDNGWFLDFFGDLQNNVDWGSEFANATTNQLFNFHPWTITQFLTAMTKDLTTKKWSETVWRDMLGPRFDVVKTTARASGSNWDYLDLWDAIDGGGGPSGDAPAPAQARFFDTLHMDRTGAEAWVVEVVDAWLAVTPYHALLGI